MRVYDESLAKKLAADQAIEWLCVLRDGGEEDRDAFCAWLKESPRHVQEFLLASTVWKSLAEIGPKDPAAIEQAVAEALESEPVANVVRFDVQRPEQFTPAEQPITRNDRGRSQNTQRKRRWRRVAAIAAAVLIVAFTSWWSIKSTPTYHTVIGEQRAVPLADGSILYLNTNSRAEVDYSKRAREVRLLEGEALFVVAHDGSRPFRVTAGDTVIQAVGTQFNVRRRAERTTVSVVEGRVKIDGVRGERATGSAMPSEQRVSSGGTPTSPTSGTPSGLPSSQPEILGAGEAVEIVGNGAIVERNSSEVAAAVAWRDRRLVFRGNTLAEVADEFNRYSRRVIRVEGAAARNKRLAGTFNADDPDSLAQFLAQKPDVLVEHEGTEIVIRDRAARPAGSTSPTPPRSDHR